MRRICLLFVAMSVVFSACSSGDGLDSDQVEYHTSNTAADSVTSSAPDEQGDADGNSGDDSGIDAESATSTTVEATTGSDQTDHDGSQIQPVGNSGAVLGSECSVDQYPRRDDYIVTGIEANDSDGGLVLRKEPINGDRIGVLPNDETVVPWLEFCEVSADGGVWWQVSSNTSGLIGWVNSAWLTNELSEEILRFYREETEEMVIVMLDALAAQDWSEALFHLVGSGIAGDIEARAGDLSGPNAEANLAAYCESHICDAPYEILTTTGSAGSFSPRSPTVTVRFSYPDGEAIEVFRGLVFEGLVDAVAPLPGGSVLALKEQPAPIMSLLAVEAERVPEYSIFGAAERIRSDLTSESGAQIPTDVIPAEGIIISARTTVDSDPAGNAVVTAEDLADGSKAFVFEYSEAGPLIETVDDWMDGYRRNLSLIEPDQTSVNAPLGYGNSLNNLADAFPEAHVVELHHRGRGEQADFNWSSTRLVLEQRDGQWKLLAIMGDKWTI